jgi:carbamoyltransferase
MNQSGRSRSDPEPRISHNLQVFQKREERRSQIAAVTNVDGSGRLQTVTRSTNPRYHALISAFRDLTGIPMVLNTSFNKNEPVVCRPEEALDCFPGTRSDILVLEDTYIERAPQDPHISTAESPAISAWGSVHALDRSSRPSPA